MRMLQTVTAALFGLTALLVAGLSEAVKRDHAV